MDTSGSEHNQHYAAGDIDAAIAAALMRLTADKATLRVRDLAALDQFHTGGLQATSMLAQQAAITAGDTVLDVGGGLGGPARLLASEYGCTVTVVDLTEAYCRAGERLSAAVGLSDRVHFQHADALDLPFADASFDVVWSQHSTMNIRDKARLASEIHRVLRPGGRLALYEVVAGAKEGLYLPVPWARSATMSFLIGPDALRTTLADAGLVERSWRDQSAWALAWLKERQVGRPQPGAAAGVLGLQLVLGPDFAAMAGNLYRNMHEDRIRIVEGIFQRREPATAAK